jgi:fibronectin-binding autotransporter adhesin
MKTTQPKHHLRARALAVLGISFCLASVSGPTYAADKTWDGGGDGVSWSASPANWDLDTAPVANDRLFFGGTTGLTPNNDFAADTDFTGITFNAGAAPFTISGAEIDLAANSGITNNSANVQTISANIDNNGANKVHNALAGDLVYLGVLRNNAIIKEGPFALTTGGPTGNSAPQLTINAGTVIMAKAAGNAFSGTIVVHTNGILRLVGAGTHVDQIHFNTRVNMNGGIWQMQHVDSVNTTRLEEIASLSGSNLTSIIENGLAASTNTLRIGGGNNHRAIYSGTLRDGAAGVLNLEVYRGNNYQQLNGTNTYSGVTLVNNVQAAGSARLIVNGQHTGGDAYTVNGHATDISRLAYLQGNGVISASVLNFNIRGVLAPGGALSADLNDSATLAETTAILTINSPVNLNDVTSTLELQLNGTTAGSGYDQVNIAGSGSFSNNNANLKISLGYPPATGDKFTIVKVQGTDSATNVGVFTTLNGVATDLSQGATFVEPGSGKNMRISYRAEGSTFDAGAGLGNDIMLEVIAPVGGQDITWRGDGTANAWDIITTANWRTTGGAAITFTNGDFVTFNDSGSNNVPVDVTTSVTPSTFLFDATKDYVLAGAGKFTGTVVLTKTNTGKLSIVTDNDNVGSTIINRGTVQIGTNGFTGTISGNVSVNANGKLEHTRADDVTLSAAFSGTGAFVHSGDGALILAANSPFSGRTTNTGGLLQLGTGVGTDGSINGDVHVSGTNVLRYLYAGDPNIANTKSGNGTVIYEAASGNRTFNLLGNVTNVNFSGSNALTAGVRLHSADNNGGYSIGNGGSVFVPDFAQVWLDRSATAYNQEFFLAGTGYTADATPLGAMRIFGCTVSGPVHLLADTRFGGSINGGTIVGKIDGAFQLEVLGNVNSFILSLGPTNGANTYGSTLVTSGAIRALNSGGISPGALTVDLNGQVDTFGNNVTVASLNNGINGAGVIYNNSTATNGTLTVGTDDASTSFDGTFGNGSTRALGLTKVGAGTLTLSGVHTNTGNVTVTGGTLALTGAGSFGNAALISVGSGAFFDVAGGGGTLTLNSGQTLGGSGTVTGNVIASSGSTIAPGTSVGTLTVAGNVTLGGGMTMELNRSLAPNSDRLVTSGGSITGGGTLTTTNIGPALQVGDTFQLFAAGVSGITANLQTVDVLNGVTYTWNNNISSSGSIQVASVTPIGQPTLGVSQSGNSLTFSWSGPFKLQSQTNSLSVGVSSNWGDYPGGSTSPVIVTINPANPTVFFRLSLQ